MDGGQLAPVECIQDRASGRYLHSAVEETVYAIRKMQCTKLHQGFTSHDARLHCSLTNEYLSFSEMKKHSKPLWAKFFPLLRSVFWGLMVLGRDGLSWGATSLRGQGVCSLQVLCTWSLGAVPLSQVFEAGGGEASAATLGPSFSPLLGLLR